MKNEKDKAEWQASQQQTGDEVLRDFFDAGYDYRSSLEEDIIEEFGENSKADFKTFLEEYKKEHKGVYSEQVLEQAVNLIKQWHNMQSFIVRRPENEIEKVWKIYYNNAPEMKIIREALSPKEREDYWPSVIIPAAFKHKKI